MADAATEFEALARALKDAGEKDLAAELRKGIRAAADPIAREVKDPAHLRSYLPGRYAEILAEDLTTIISQRTGRANPGVSLVARGRRHNRHVARINQGILRHPVFARSDQLRRQWTWRDQLDGVRPRFFDDPVAASGPEVRDQIAAAVRRVIDKIYAAP